MKTAHPAKLPVRIFDAAPAQSRIVMPAEWNSRLTPGSIGAMATVYLVDILMLASLMLATFLVVPAARKKK